MSQPYFTPPESALVERFILAAGPGGQNVNKVATAVELRLQLSAWPDLAWSVKQRLRRLAGRSLTKGDEIVLVAQRFRTQAANRRDAHARLKRLIEKASYRAPPRIATKPTLASKRRRVDTKKKRGALKRLRRSTADD